MCLICVEYEKERLTIREARRNLEEMKEKVGDIHYDEVKTMLIQKELEKLRYNLDKLYGFLYLNIYFFF